MCQTSGHNAIGLDCGMLSVFRALGAFALALGACVDPARAQFARSAAGESRTLEASGESRRYYLYLPASFRRERPAPLVLVFHAGGGRASDIAPHTGFSRLADREGFVVAYPQGLRGRWNDGPFHFGTKSFRFVPPLLGGKESEGIFALFWGLGN